MESLCPFHSFASSGAPTGRTPCFASGCSKGQLRPRSSEGAVLDVCQIYEYEDDPRYSKPSIKNAPSIRQLPVSEVVALIVREYVSNYRGRVSHSFLLNSQKSVPMSPEAVSKTFQKVTSSLPGSLRKLLLDKTGDGSITAHAMRHTCAVVRLNQILAEGVEMSDALQRLRVFLGPPKKSLQLTWGIPT